MRTKIYALRDGHWIRYVGKTIRSLEARLTSHLVDARNERNQTHKCRGIRKILRQGKLPRITLIEIAAGDGSVEEKKWIKFFRDAKITLWNGTDGGDGVLDSTGEVAKKIGDSLRGKKKSQAHIAKMVESRKGFRQSLEARRKISEALKGNKHLLGYHHSKESLSKISATLKGHPVSNKCVESLRKRSIGNKYFLGRKHSEETIKKLRGIRSLYWKRKREQDKKVTI